MGRMGTSPTVPHGGDRAEMHWGCFGAVEDFEGACPPPVGLFLGREHYNPPIHQVSSRKSGSVVWESVNPSPAGLVPPSWDSSGSPRSHVFL